MMAFSKRQPLSHSSMIFLCFLGLLPFSYQPLVQLGTVNGLHIDITLLYVFAIITLLSSVFVISRNIKIFTNTYALSLLTIWASFILVSTTWSPNPVRGLAISLFSFMLIGLIAVIILKKDFVIARRQLIIKLLSVSMAITLIWSFWQIIGNALGVSSSYTLLPAMYGSETFGVARPTGFALEPQFLGSLLIVPLLWSLWMTWSSKHSSYVHIGASIALSTLLILTLSRGALLAALVSVVISLIATSVSNKQILKNGSVTIVSLITSIILASGLIAGAASINTSDSISGYQALSKSLNQLTFGRLSLPSENEPRSTTMSSPASTATPAPETTGTGGYVASSTDSRLSMSSVATDIWQKSPWTILFGVGIGGFGASAASISSEFNSGTIANNTYLELLAETGIIGLGLFLVSLFYLIARLYQKKQWLVLAGLVGFLLQWCFFSGNANVIHVWMWIGVAVAMTDLHHKKSLKMLQ